MRNRVKSFTKSASRWIASNIAWDVIKSVASLLFGWLITLKVPAGIVDAIGGFLSPLGLSVLDWAIVFILISSAMFGMLSLLSPLIQWFKNHILRSDKPFLVQSNEWNAIIDYEGGKVGVAMISIDNKPARSTENSVAYSVSARIDFFDRKDNHLLQIKCGYWTRTGPERFFAESGKKRKCEKVDFYSNDTWYLPVVYKWESEDIVFAYDHSSSIKSKKLGKLPIKFSVTFESENLNLTRPINYLLVPQPGGSLDGFWIQKK
ncbi:MAG: hypothetical protein ACYC6R_15285 [Anaerolineales bacterium]